MIACLKRLLFNFLLPLSLVQFTILSFVLCLLRASSHGLSLISANFVCLFALVHALVVLETGTEIKFSGQHKVLSVNRVNTTAMSFVDEKSFILGLNSWIFIHESAKLRAGNPHYQELNMTRWSKGEFTCSSGDCVSMEERWDQAPNCKDKSDEVDFRLLELEKNYNKKVPPFTSSQGNTIIPVQLDVSILFSILYSILY